MVSWELIDKATAFIAEEMGVALKRSAFSPNIKERVDHSCAVVDDGGRIVAQAEHIPVHLGSFRVCVMNLIRFLSEEGVELGDGDMVAFNDPYISGTHLNDMTVVAPVIVKGETFGYVINKAHLVDVGGPLPGSINPNASTIYEEGIVVPPVLLMKNGKMRRDVLGLLAANFKTPDVTIGDLLAQVAANQVGVRRIQELVTKYGADSVREAWDQTIDHTKELVIRELSAWPRGDYYGEDYIEVDNDDLTIRVKLSISPHSIVADYEGSSRQVDLPLNAVFGVTYSSTVFVVRCILNVDVGVNEGLYSVVDVRAVPSTIVNPVRPAPVAGGNVETSQRIADVMFRAFSQALPGRVPAAGSGTMMNVMMGGKLESGGYWAYYETIGGGTGARPNSDGVSGVHVNMTNTLNTPIEVAERTYPLFFTGYRIREMSGGRGRFRGGDGVIRSFKVLVPCRLSILSDRFKRGAWGLMGGEDGAPGKVTVIRANGEVLSMPSKFSIELRVGDEVIIETPGGGGLYSKD
ncbi:MAG: hydantoinase B/oxoprolinase family protein [Aigarchaeota archaeon]|nr:hydantoinase B/oxoprolinase family protein [Aigarchaeota archaeon]MDW8092947.1 hydantoinase B/oxoprolinase family protein [Nitrososphaerota archaeon]